MYKNLNLPLNTKNLNLPSNKKNLNLPLNTKKLNLPSNTKNLNLPSNTKKINNNKSNTNLECQNYRVFYIPNTFSPDDDEMLNAKNQDREAEIIANS